MPVRVPQEPGPRHTVLRRRTRRDIVLPTTDYRLPATGYRRSLPYTLTRIILSMTAPTSRPRAIWTAKRVAALRARLGLTQTGFADEMGVRQQTVSEWETGRYAPRGASARLLSLLEERAPYDTGPTTNGEEDN